MRHILRSVLLAAGFALLLVPAVTPAPALAATFTVDSVADEPDASPGDSVCRSTLTSRCTLRAAIMEANTLAGSDTITLPAGTFRLTVSGVDDAAAMGDLDITSALDINGVSPTQTIIDASTLVTPDRVFDVQPEGRVHLNRLRITGGHPLRSLNGYDGGGIRVFGGGNASLTNVSVDHNQSDSAGGGIVVRATGVLSLRDSSVDSNWATLNGGGISAVNGTLTLIKSTVSRNTSNQSGGGILYAGSQFTAENSTISTNTAGNTGGGLFLNFNSSTTGQTSYASYLTVANNVAPTPGSGGNIYVVSQPGAQRFNLKTSIVAGGTQGGNCGGLPVASGGFNLEDQNVCGFTAAGDLVNTNPTLDALKFDNSVTQVHPLPRTSPAVDVITTCSGTDQRSVARPQDGNGDGIARCDIGAYELTYQ